MAKADGKEDSREVGWIPDEPDWGEEYQALLARRWEGAGSGVRKYLKELYERGFLHGARVASESRRRVGERE